jgi:cellulase/cellobiase CelA1
VTVTAGAATTNGWTTRWTLSGGQTISQAWNAIVTISGTVVTVRNVDWNGSLNPRGSTTFGFIAGGSPSTPAVTCTSP